MMVPAMHPIVFIALLHGGGSVGAPQETSLLLGQARELLISGHPAKAEILLKRARALDSTQSEVDRLRAQCRAALGQWVPPEGGSDWILGDDRLTVAVREKPDSLFALAQSLLGKEDIALAARIAWALSQSNAASPAHLKLSQELRSRQDALIAFHADLARKAQGRGDLEEVAAQWRLAWSARPEDAALRDQVQRAEDVRRSAIADLRSILAKALASKDESSAYEIASKARVAFSATAPFQRVYDSLRVFRMAARNARLDRINAMADQGMEQEAMDAMEALVESDAMDPSLELAQSMLQSRLQKRRRRAQVAELVRVCESAVAGGDILRSSEALADLRKLGADGPELDRLPARIDSLRATRKALDAFDETMAQARAALRSGDASAARAQLQKAAVLQPSSAVVKGLLASLAASRQAVVAGSAKGLTNPVAASSGTADLAPDELRRSKELLLAGVAAYRAGEYDRAIQSWKQVLEIDTGCVQARKYLANVGLKQTRLK